MVSEFVEELRLQFERYVQVKNRLDTKANNIIAMSGTIATLFMGFGVFLLQNVDFQTYSKISEFASFSLILEIILTVLTIVFAFTSYRLREYTHPISFEKFFKQDKKEPDPTKVKQFQDADSDQINEWAIDNYLKSIKSYEEQNNEQTKWIDYARFTFTGAIIIIPIFAFLIILTKYPT